jgi:anti-anti-sigma regulatory factor
MNDDAALWTDREFTLTVQRAGWETLLVTLGGELGIAHVEELAACADRVCGTAVRNVRLELGGLAAVDEPGARTLAAACQCLRLNGRRVQVRGLRPEVSLVLAQLGLTLDGSIPIPAPRVPPPAAPNPANPAEASAGAC